MSLGSHDPTWSALASELAACAEAAGAANAFVGDAWGHLWCRAHPVDPARALESIGRALAASKRPLQRGGRIAATTPLYAARSFGSAYVLVLDFAAPCDQMRARRAIDRHLAAIERLTIALPPPGGPDANSAAGKQRA